MTINKSNLFKSAWTIARTSAKRNGGKAVEYLSGALKQAWTSAKTVAENVAATLNKKSYKGNNDKDVIGQNVTFTHLSNIQDSFYGQTGEFFFEDAAGKVYIWTTKLNGWIASKLEEGKNYVINFNIKNEISNDTADINYVGFAK